MARKNEDSIHQFYCDPQGLFEQNYDKVVLAYIEYYHRRARNSKYGFYFWSILKVLLVCLLPVFQATNIMTSFPWMVAAFSSGILFIESILELWRFREKWILYRNTCNKIMSIQRQFAGRRADVCRNMADYIAAVEAIIGDEAKEWIASTAEKQKKA